MKATSLPLRLPAAPAAQAGPPGATIAILLWLTWLGATQAAESPVSEGQPKSAKYYSAQRLSQGVPVPPLPGSPFPKLPVYPLDEWSFVFDDREVDYEELRREAGDAPSGPSQSFDRGAALEALGDCASELLIRLGSNSVTLTITNASEGKIFDLFRTFELVGDAITNSFWLWVTNGSNGQSFTLPTCPCARVFYVLACTNDTDGDGLSDAFEVLVNQTSPLTNHSVNVLYTDREMVNVLINDPEHDCGTEQNTQDETTLIAFSNTVIAAWVDSNLGQPGYGFPDFACDPPWLPPTVPQWIGWAVSRNGGASFVDRGPLPLLSNVVVFVVTNYSGSGYFAVGDLGNGGDPVLARDNESGTIYLTGIPTRPSVYYPNGSHQPPSLFTPVWRSTDGGEAFTPPLNALTGLVPTNAATDYADKPALVVVNTSGAAQGDAFLAIQWLNGSSNRLVISRLEGGDTNWQVLHPFFGGQGAHRPSWAVRTNAETAQYEICLLWTEPRAGIEHLMFSKSADRGTNFSIPTQVLSLVQASGSFVLPRYTAAGDGFRAPINPTLVANPINGHLYVAYHDAATNGSTVPQVYFTQSTDGGTSWSERLLVSWDPNGTPTDKWQPVLTVKPDGTQLFIGWYDRRDDPLSNGLIRIYGSIATLPVTGASSFATNFAISTVAFPPVFTGTNTAPGTYDPVFPPEVQSGEPRYCGSFFGVYANHMGDYDTAVSDDTYIFCTWADNRRPGAAGKRREADVRMVRLPWVH